MRKKVIKHIVFKELRDIFRDKKTVFMMIFLPIILYPVLMIGFTQIATLSSKAMEKKELEIALAFEADDKLLEIIEETNSSNDEQGKLILTEKGNLEEALEKEEIAAYVTKEEKDGKDHYKIYMNASSDDSSLASQRIRSILSKYKEYLVKLNLEDQGLDADEVLEPVTYESVNTAKKEEMTGYLLGLILPLFLIIGILLGAIYPAIDVMAGEKERGTLETLLTLPVSNLELIIGKYLAVASVAVLSALLNILSIVLSVVFLLLQLGEQVEELNISFNFSEMLLPLGITLVCILLFALVITAVVMCVCSLAKSFKDAQNYATPIMFLFMLPAYACILPNLEFNTTTAMIPVVNIALMIKSVFLFKFNGTAILIVFISSLAFAILSLMLLAKMFNSEAVLFGEGKGLSFLERRHNIKKNSMPGVGDALVLYAVAMLLLVYVGGLLQLKLGILGLALTEIMFLILTVGLAYYIKADFKKLFSLKMTGIKSILGALILWFGTFILTFLLTEIMIIIFPDSMETIEKLNMAMLSMDNLWINLLVLAFLPAVCEETLFRGFIFGSLKREENYLWPIMMTALMFGIMHIYPIKFIPTTILGFVLTYALYKTESIFIPMLIHFANNATAVLVSHFSPDNAVNSQDIIGSLELNFAFILRFLILLAFSGGVMIAGIHLLKSDNKAIQKDMTNT